MKRSALAVVLLLLLLSFASAASVKVKSEIPAEINWSFSINLDSTDSFDRTTVMVDTSEILTIYPEGSGVHIFPVKGSLVLDYFAVDTDTGSNDGVVLYVSYIGLPPGNHTIRLKTYTEDDMVSLDETTWFYDVIDEINESDLAAEVAAMKADISALYDDIKTIEADYKVFWDKLGQREGEITALSGKVDNFGAKVEPLQGQLDSLSSQLDSLSSQLQQLSGNVGELADAVVTELEGVQYAANTGAGEEQPDLLALFGLVDVSMLAVLLGAVIVLVTGAFLVKKKLAASPSVYAEGKEEGELIEAEETEEDEQPEEEPEEEKPGKWAFKE